MSHFSIHDRSAFVPIPSIFHSLRNGGPFTQCLICDRPLLGDCRLIGSVSEDRLDKQQPSDDGPQANPPTYFIERIFRGNEPIIEYALCLDCDDDLRSEISKDSLEKINHFFSEHVDLERRAARINAGQQPRSIESWLNACVVTKENFTDCHEKQIFAVCQGDQLALPTSMMLSGTAISMVMPLLSKKTRDWIGDFTGTNFGMPPEFCDQPDVFPVLL